MFYPTDDLRIKWTKVVTPPVFLEKELPTTENASSTVYHAREEIRNIIAGRDHRLLVIAGPCSIHDTQRLVTTHPFSRVRLPSVLMSCGL
jgi:3-deoxy-7-phosphoheptulonate synthase